MSNVIKTLTGNACEAKYKYSLKIQKLDNIVFKILILERGKLLNYFVRKHRKSRSKTIKT